MENQQSSSATREGAEQRGKVGDGLGENYLKTTYQVNDLQTEFIKNYKRQSNTLTHFANHQTKQKDILS